MREIVLIHIWGFVVIFYPQHTIQFSVEAFLEKHILFNTVIAQLCAYILMCDMGEVCIKRPVKLKLMQFKKQLLQSQSRWDCKVL
jgi:hypothetical protein